MNFRPIALSLALLSVTATAVAAVSADTNSFDIFNLKGAKTATSTYTVAKTKDGLKVHGEVDYVADGTGGVRSTNYVISKAGALDSGTLENPADRTLTFFTPNKANDALTIRSLKSHVEAGKRTVQISQPHVLVAFPDDTSVWHVFLQLAADHPHADNIYWMLVPATATKGDRLEPFRLNAPIEATGTLDGKPVTLKHYVLNFNAGTSHLYTDADGNLMSAKLSALGVSHVRNNFTLDK